MVKRRGRSSERPSQYSNKLPDDPELEWCLVECNGYVICETAETSTRFGELERDQSHKSPASSPCESATTPCAARRAS